MARLYNSVKKYFGKAKRRVVRQRLSDAADPKRRTFMAAAALAPAAVPSLAAALSNPASAGGKSFLLGAAASYGENTLDYPTAALSDGAPSRASRLAQYHEQLKSLDGLLAERKAIGVRQFKIGGLQVDLALNRSMSVATKVRLQAERDALAYVEGRRRNILDWIADLDKQPGAVECDTAQNTTRRW